MARNVVMITEMMNKIKITALWSPISTKFNRLQSVRGFNKEYNYTKCVKGCTSFIHKMSEEHENYYRRTYVERYFMTGKININLNDSSGL
jgi:hypothetical protein